MNPVICIEMIYPGIKQEEKLQKLNKQVFPGLNSGIGEIKTSNFFILPVISSI